MKRLIAKYGRELVVKRITQILFTLYLVSFMLSLLVTRNVVDSIMVVFILPAGGVTVLAVGGAAVSVILVMIYGGIEWVVDVILPKRKEKGEEAYDPYIKETEGVLE